MFANGGKPLEIAIRSGNTVMLRKLFVHSSPHFQNLGAEPCVDDGDEVAGDDDEENDEEVDVESLHCSMKRRDMLLIFRRVVNDWDQYIDVGTTCAMWLRRSLTPSSRRRMWCGIRPPLLPAASRPLVLQTRHCQILELLQGSQSPKPKPMIYKLSINCHVGKLTQDFHFSAAKSFFSSFGTIRFQNAMLNAFVTNCLLVSTALNCCIPHGIPLSKKYNIYCENLIGIPILSD